MFSRNSFSYSLDIKQEMCSICLHKYKNVKRMKKNIECTLVLIKPDGVTKGLDKEVFARYRRAFLKVINCSDKITATGEQLYQHYEGIGQLLTRKGEAIFKETVDYMMSGPILKAIIVGEDAVQKVRELNGATKPWEAKKGTIRADFGETDPKGPIRNVVHPSATLEEAKEEIKVWFSKEELKKDLPNQYQEYYPD